MYAYGDTYYTSQNASVYPCFRILSLENRRPSVTDKRQPITIYIVITCVCNSTTLTACYPRYHLLSIIYYLLLQPSAFYHQKYSYYGVRTRLSFFCTRLASVRTSCISRPLFHKRFHIPPSFLYLILFQGDRCLVPHLGSTLDSP